MLRLCLALALLSPVAAAQLGEGDFLVVGSPDQTTDLGGGIFLVDPINQTSTPLGNVTGDLLRASAIVADPSASTIWYLGTNGTVKNVAGPANLYRLLVAGGTVVSATKLNTDTLTTDVEISALQIVGDELIFGSRTRLGSLSKNGGQTKTLLPFVGTNNYPALASDGRFLYANIYNNSGWRTGGSTVRRFDLQDLTLPPVDLFSVDQFPTSIRSISVDSQYRLLEVDKGNFASPMLRQFDLRTNLKIQEVTLPFQSLQGVRFAEMDPFNEVVVIVGQGKTPADASHYAVTVKGWQVLGTFYGAANHPLTGVGVRRTPGLVRRGYECASSLIPAPYSAARSTPTAGNASYAFELLAPASSVGIFLLGAAGGLPSPIPLVPTKCELGVSPILVLAGATNANGSLLLPLPMPATAAGLSLDTQWAVLDAKANSLGLVTTQVGRVYIR